MRKCEQNPIIHQIFDIVSVNYYCNKSVFLPLLISSFSSQAEYKRNLRLVNQKEKRNLGIVICTTPCFKK